MIQHIREKQFPIIIGLVLLIAGLLFTVIPNNLSQRVDRWIYDTALSAAPKSPSNAPLIMVNIDNASLATQGPWPWSHKTLLTLLGKIAQQRPKVIVFTTPLRHNEDNIGALVTNYIQSLNEDVKIHPQIIEKVIAEFTFEEDLIKLFGKSPIMLTTLLIDDELIQSSGSLPKPISLGTPPKQLNIPLLRIHIGNIPELQKVARYDGIMTSLADSDGVIRRVPLLLQHQHHYYPEISLLLMQVLQNNSQFDLLDNEHATVGKLNVPIDQQGQLWVPFRSPGQFTQLSANQVIHGHHTSLQDKIVIIAATSPQLESLVRTPIAVQYPHSYITASLVDAAHRQFFITHPRWAIHASVTTMVLAGIIMIFVFPCLNAIGVLGVGILSLLVLCGSYFIALNYCGLLIPISGSALTITIATCIDIALLRIIQIYRSSLRYIPQRFLDTLNKKSILATQVGDCKKQDVAIMFCDVRDFTGLLERYPTDKGFDLVNRYWQMMAPVIRKHNGFVMKFIGDAILAVFPKHVDDAVNAGIALKQALMEFNQHDDVKDQPWKVGIGISYGLAMLGLIGETERIDATVISDITNIASRIESLNKSYETTFLISGEAHQALLQKTHQWRQVDKVRLKGKQLTTFIFELVDWQEQILGQTSQDYLDTYSQAFNFYLNGDFEHALNLAQQCQLHRNADPITALLVKRCTYYLKMGKPNDWDGTTTLTHK